MLVAQPRDVLVDDRPNPLVLRLHTRARFVLVFGERGGREEVTRVPKRWHVLTSGKKICDTAATAARRTTGRSSREISSSASTAALVPGITTTGPPDRVVPQPLPPPPPPATSSSLSSPPTASPIADAVKRTRRLLPPCVPSSIRSSQPSSPPAGASAGGFSWTGLRVESCARCTGSVTVFDAKPVATCPIDRASACRATPGPREPLERSHK